ncbi:unnamed protein product [Phytophthora fragariaefolia]|uniref:Unnamed protein product n=1 Tax=Phytophthora fragariaefolia TaxID=1490495 RepID=A0A9W6XIJ7_9STRA|nr:unnamed protein product [Phytophthora fragariaefolia]
MHRSSDEEGAARAPEFQLIRRKRPRTPESGGAGEHFAFPARGSPEKAPRLMVLPGLAELLAAQKQRNEGVAADALLDVLSRATSAEQEQQQHMEEEIEVEDKTPWPSAKQYFDIFSAPKSELKIPVYDLGVDPRGVPLHPEFIYSQPVSCMYFLKCSRLLGKGSFGFPRKKKSAGETTPTSTPTGSAKKPAGKSGKKESSKDFEWRKMSFVTGLPKKQPIVRYITATCYSRATDVAAKKKVFRMHAVMLADEAGTGEQGEYVLVHIRAGGSKRVGLRASVADAETQQAPSSPGAHGTATTNADLLCMRRPVSPTSVAVSSYSSSTASTSPRHKKLLHAEFSAGPGDSSEHFARVLAASPALPTGVESMPSVTRHPLFTSTEDPKVDSARQALRNMILKSCTSRDEMAKYVMGLQEELAALQNQ